MTALLDWLCYFPAAFLIRTLRAASRPGAGQPPIAGHAPEQQARGQSKHSIGGTVRLAALPRANRAADFRGLDQAQPSGEQQGGQPGQRDSKANAADDDQPSRHDRCQAPCDLTNSNHELGQTLRMRGPASTTLGRVRDPHRGSGNM